MFTKTIVASVIGLMATVAFAQNPPMPNAPQKPPMAQNMQGKGPMGGMGGQGVNRPQMNAQAFPEHKQNVLSRIEQREKMLAEEKACVQKAAAPADLQACRQEMRQDRMEMKQNMQSAPGMMQGNGMQPGKRMGQPPMPPQGNAPQGAPVKN